MRQSRIATLVLFLVLLGATGGGARSGDGLECARTQCEGQGRTCVQTLYATFEACRKAANRKCNGVQYSEKFNCLKTELTPCALARNAEQATCLADVQRCHASCGPVADQLVHYWCVAEFDTAVTAAFCATDPASDRPMESCEKVMISEGQQQFGAMTCEPL